MSQSDQLQDSGSKHNARPRSLFTALLIGALIFLGLILLFEGLFRWTRLDQVFTWRSLGVYHGQFEIKWFTLKDYARQNREVDVLLAFEKVEALRCLRQLRPGALALVNMEAIEPLTVTSGDAVYPDDERLFAAVAQVTSQAAYIPGPTLAAQVGNPKTANVVLLGALSAMMARQAADGMQVPVDTWLSVIIERVPARYVDLNKCAFEAGRQAVLHPA